MIQLVIGIIIGLLVIPILIIFYPNMPKIKGRSNNLAKKTYSKKEIPVAQARNVLKSLHQCTDLYWLNVLINKFWCELADSSAQAYRLKKRIKKLLDEIPGTGIIRSIEVLNIDIGNEGPMIKGIRIISSKDVQRLLDNLNEKKSMLCKNSKKEYIKKDGFIDCDKIYEDIFKNVQSLTSVLFEGSIKINLKIGFPKNISLHTNVFINKIEGDILTRFPSIDYNTRLEYTFLSNPNMEIYIEAGVTKGEGEEYFKQIISKFLRRTIKYSFLKSFVYPTFNTLYLPMIVPHFKNFEHKIRKSVSRDLGDIDEIRDSLCLLLAMDFKITEIVNDITYRSNNLLLNDKEKIYCAHFTIPECALNSSQFTTNRNFIYEKLTIKESKIMNQIYDLSIFKDVISSFKEIVTVKNFNSASSLIEIIFTDKKMEFLRIVHNDTIFFQKNDEENPEFIIFTIRNKDLFVYSFITTTNLKMTKSRITKLKAKLEMKYPRKSTLTKIFKYSKSALIFWRPQNEKRSLLETVDDVKNIIENTENQNFKDLILKIQNTPIEGKPISTHKFNCSKNIIFNILLQEEVRIKFISEQTKIFRFINENEDYKSIAIENKEDEGNDIVLHTFNNDNMIVDIVNNKKIIYELKEKEYDLVSRKFIDLGPSTSLHSRDFYKMTSISESELDKRAKIKFLDVCASNKCSVDIENIPSTGQTKINQKTNNIETVLNIYVDDGVIHSTGNHLYESIYTRITQQKIKILAEESDFEKLDLKKELRKDFYGDLGGVYIEFKTDTSDDFKFTLYSTVLKKNLLAIQKVITSRPVKMIIPIFKEDILLLKLVPKFHRNGFINIKVVNLPKKYHRESLIDCNIGLMKNGQFSFPIIGSPKNIIFWEKEKDEQIKGNIESPYTKVPISGNGTMRTDQMNYSVLYKNKGVKCREIKIYMGVTKKD